MKIEQIYNNLKELAEKLGITVSELSFKNAGIKVKSGLCIVKGQQMFIMNKHKNTRSKVDILASCLATFPLDDIYIVPTVRDVLDKYKTKIKKTVENPPEGSEGNISI
jgi:hypothetical protein